MSFKKQYLIILLAALILGFVGAFAGVKLAQGGQTQTEDAGLRTANNNQTIASDNLDKVDQAFQLIKKNYLHDVKDQDLIDGAVKGMLDTLDDPFSSYMDKDEMADFDEEMESSFEGIGAEVSKTNGEVTIIAPIKNSPAEDAGLRPNDQILKVDGDRVNDLELTEAVNKIRGKKGSNVSVEVKRPGKTDPFEVKMKRDEIPVETVYSKIKKANGKKTGVLEITTFSETTAKEFKEQLTKLEEKNIDGLVIDVRGNPGGLLDSVEDILKQFIPSDMPYVQIEDQDGKKTPYKSDLKKKKDYPINVLTDEGSASASEILAIALKEAGYDTVGTKSYGKGTVQQAVPMGDGSSIKLTYYKWLSPKGNWIHKKGIKPSIKVKQPDYYYVNQIDVDKPITYDHTGDKVKNIQIMLDGLGYDPGREDGYFDKETQKAVKQFQKKESLKVTGDVDKKTGELIQSKIMDHVRDGDDDKQLKSALKNIYK